jgi:hypothetical protein
LKYFAKLFSRSRARQNERGFAIYAFTISSGGLVETGADWPPHAVSRWVGHTKLTTTDTYLNPTTQPLHEMNERKPLTLVKT